jgi:nitrogen fixation NifU-like protein
MDELRELYQEIILDHNKSPKNFKRLERATHSSEGYNPLCGDKVHLDLEILDGKVEDIGFQGSGCAISKASASVMTTMIKGKSIAEIEKMFEQFKSVITSDVNDEVDCEALGKLAIFAGVREFPTRVKCASLAWHTMLSALKKEKEPVSTE